MDSWPEKIGACLAVVLLFVITVVSICWGFAVVWLFCTWLASL